ncbi:MAG: hypothetical protein GY750_08315 [Lentisphaerae bacterium]|nr:hypothetical protein [Lentisphaerota bacterium]
MLKEGDVIEIKEGHRVYADVPEHFVYSNRKGCYGLTYHDITVGGEFAYFAGKYVVVKTSLEGGGAGHGPHDIYPDGHRVYCVKADLYAHDRTVKVDFYQTGSFTAMIEDIEPIGRARLEWTMIHGFNVADGGA